MEYKNNNLFKDLNNSCSKKTSNNNEQQNQKLEQIAEEILTEYKYAFEVLGNGEVE